MVKASQGQLCEPYPFMISVFTCFNISSCADLRRFTPLRVYQIPLTVNDSTMMLAIILYSKHSRSQNPSHHFSGLSHSGPLFTSPITPGPGSRQAGPALMP